jgi:hypothetical protein
MLDRVQRSTKIHIITIQAITCEFILIASTLNLFKISLIAILVGTIRRILSYVEIAILI